MKYLYLGRKQGLKVAVVNPYREPGLDRYWVPSNVESAIFGTKMTDEFFAVHTGGDVAFINGVLKCLIDSGSADQSFIRDHTEGWGELRAMLERQSFERRTSIAVAHDEQAAGRQFREGARAGAEEQLEILDRHEAARIAAHDRVGDGHGATSLAQLAAAARTPRLRRRSPRRRSSRDRCGPRW